METPSPTEPVVEPPHTLDQTILGSTKHLGDWIKTSGHLHGAVMVTLALALLGSMAWSAIASHRAEARRASDRAALIRDADDAMIAQSSALLRLSALPLGWAMRSAVLKDDWPSVDAYLQRMISERHVSGAAFIGPDQKVRLAGNRKLEKLTAHDAFPGIALDANEPTVTATGQTVRVVVPIMGYDRRLGSLILSYALPTPATWMGQHEL